MAKGDIKLSQKFGVNPSMVVCPICGKDAGVVLHGRLPGDEQAPHKHNADEPCEDCILKIEEHKKLGFMFFIIADQYENLISEGKKPRSPWLFFLGYQVVRNESQVFECFKDVDLSKGCAFISEKVALELGLWPIKAVQNA